jgi:hypothetical protein
MEEAGRKADPGIDSSWTGHVERQGKEGQRHTWDVTDRHPTFRQRLSVKSIITHAHSHNTKPHSKVSLTVLANNHGKHRESKVARSNQITPPSSQSPFSSSPLPDKHVSEIIEPQKNTLSSHPQIPKIDLKNAVPYDESDNYHFNLGNNRTSSAVNPIFRTMIPSTSLLRLSGTEDHGFGSATPVGQRWVWE